eukprot:scaffold19562_cov128-Skeletonema_dohrnii-CCMP3373.AAC.2
MSTDSVEAEAAADICCASCGIGGVDDVKLKKCDACDLVQYCSDNCKQDHRSQHEQSCKKRAAELREELLFRQPESTHVGDCPICCLPLSINGKRCTVMSCCSKWICDGCDYANLLRQLSENLQVTCLFCRHRVPTTHKELEANALKRIAANDPVAMTQLGFTRENEGDYDSAFGLWTNAAELGDAIAHWALSIAYAKGQGVEADQTKKMYHLEEAAIAGHPQSRHNLGCYAMRSGKYDRGVKHWIICANLGHDEAIKVLKECYKGGVVSKEEFAAALRAHQAAVDATKSPQREEAGKALGSYSASQLWKLTTVHYSTLRILTSLKIIIITAKVGNDKSIQADVDAIIRKKAAKINLFLRRDAVGVHEDPLYDNDLH